MTRDVAVVDPPVHVVAVTDSVEVKMGRHRWFQFGWALIGVARDDLERALSHTIGWVHSQAVTEKLQRGQHRTDLDRICFRILF